LITSNPDALLEPNAGGDLPLQALLRQVSPSDHDSCHESVTQVSIADHVRVLLDACPKAAQEADRSGLPLYVALKYLDGLHLLAVLHVLLQHAPDACAELARANGDSGLHLIARRGNWKFAGLAFQEIIRNSPGCLLLKNLERQTALHIALQNSTPTVAIMMLINSCPPFAQDRRGASVFEASDEQGNTPLHLAMANPQTSPAVIAELVGACAHSVTFANRDEHTPLYVGLASGVDVQLLAAIVPATMEYVRAKAIAAELESGTSVDQPGQIPAIFQQWRHRLPLRLGAQISAAAGDAVGVDPARWTVADTAAWLKHVALPAEHGELDSMQLLALARGSLPTHHASAKFTQLGVDGLALRTVRAADDYPLSLLAAAQVRKTPSWPRSRSNSSLL
jgi:hypothetical protein